MTRPLDPAHATNVRVKLDGHALEGLARDEGLLIAHALDFVARLSFTTADGEPIAIRDVVALDALAAHAGTGCPRHTVRGGAALLASVAASRESVRNAPPRLEAPPPTPSDVARAAGNDLARLEREAQDRLDAIRAARERHAQLLSEGDAVAASEVRAS